MSGAAKVAKTQVRKRKGGSNDTPAENVGDVDTAAKAAAEAEDKNSTAAKGKVKAGAKKENDGGSAKGKTGQADEKEEEGSVLMAAFVFLIVAGVMGGGLYWFGSQAGWFAAGPAPYLATIKRIIAGQVPVVTVTPETDLGARFAPAEEPVVIKNTVAETWPAFEWWTFHFLMRYKEWLQNTQMSEDPTFVYLHSGPDFPMTRWPDLLNEHKERAYSKVDISGDNMLAFLNAEGPRREYYYWGTPLSGAYDMMTLSKQATPNEFLTVRPANNTVGRRFVKSQLWVGAAGSVTHAHYDGFHNFFVQVRGRKRFVLFPPAEHSNLYLYPVLHPGALQSQVDFNAPDLERFPNFANARGVEAVVEAGDVLYVPPMWFHYVITEENSISVSVWSNNSETAPSYEAQTREFIPSMWKAHSVKKALAGHYVLRSVLDAVLGSEAATRSLIKDFLAERYGPLLDRFGHRLNPGGGRRSYCLDDMLAEYGKDPSSLYERLDLDINAMVASLKENIYDDDRRLVYLANIAEFHAYRAVDMDDVYPFLVAVSEC